MIWTLLFRVTTLSLIPSAAISVYIIRKYRVEGLNITLFSKLMIMGSLSVIPAMILVSLTSTLFSENLLSAYVLKPFFAVALIEELIKLLIIKQILYRNSSFETIKNGIQYSIAIAIGFAFAENIIYLITSGYSLSLIVTRSLTALPLHTVCGAFMGYFAGLGKTEEKRFYAKSLFSTVLLHGLYNVLVNLYFPYYLLSIILMFSSLLFLKQLYSKKQFKHL